MVAKEDKTNELQWMYKASYFQVNELCKILKGVLKLHLIKEYLFSLSGLFKNINATIRKG